MEAGVETGVDMAGIVLASVHVSKVLAFPNSNMMMWVSCFGCFFSQSLLDNPAHFLKGKRAGYLYDSTVSILSLVMLGDLREVD